MMDHVETILDCTAKMYLTLLSVNIKCVIHAVEVYYEMDVNIVMSFNGIRSLL